MRKFILIILGVFLVAFLSAEQLKAAAGDPIEPWDARSSGNWLGASSAWNAFSPEWLDENNQFSPTDQLTGNWLSEGENPATYPVNQQWILVDLGSPYDLDRLHVWNYYENTAWAGGLDTSTRGMQGFSLWVAGAGATVPAQDVQMETPFTTANGWTEVIADGSLAKSPIGAVYDDDLGIWVKGPPIDPTDIIFDTIGLLDIQYIGFDVHTSHGAEYGGLGQVQIIEGDSYKASGPDPYDGEDMVALDKILSWSPPVSFTPTGYNVYIDRDKANVEAGTGCAYTSLNQPGTSFDPVPDLLPSAEGDPNSLYYWRVDSLGNSSGSPGTIWEFMTLPENPIITEQPEPLTLSAGETAVFSVSGISQTAFQWKVNGVDVSDGTTGSGAVISGAETDTLTITGVQQAEEGNYTCLLSNPLGSTESDAAQLLTKRLISHWPLNGTLEDIVGGWDGEPNSTPIWSGLALENTLVSIPGSEDYFNFYPRGFTGTFWIKPRSATSLANLLTKYSTVDQMGFHHYVGGSASDVVAMIGGPWVSLVAVGQVTPNAWNHIASTYDPDTSTYKLYVNAKLWPEIDITVDPGYVRPSGAIVQFGFSGITPESEGVINQVRIFSYALSLGEIAQVYATDSGMSYCSHEIAPMDLAGDDCIVTLLDFAALAEEWLVDSTIYP